MQALIYITLTNRNYLKLHQQERHAEEHNKVGEPGLLEMVKLTISSNRLTLVPNRQVTPRSRYRNFPKMREHVPEIKNRAM